MSASRVSGLATGSVAPASRWRGRAPTAWPMRASPDACGCVSCVVRLSRRLSVSWWPPRCGHVSLLRLPPPRILLPPGPGLRYCPYRPRCGQGRSRPPAPASRAPPRAGPDASWTELGTPVPVRTSSAEWRRAGGVTAPGGLERGAAVLRCGGRVRDLGPGGVLAEQGERPRPVHHGRPAGCHDVGELPPVKCLGRGHDPGGAPRRPAAWPPARRERAPKAPKVLTRTRRAPRVDEHRGHVVVPAEYLHAHPAASLVSSVRQCTTASGAGGEGASPACRPWPARRRRAPPHDRLPAAAVCRPVEQSPTVLVSRTSMSAPRSSNTARTARVFLERRRVHGAAPCRPPARRAPAPQSSSAAATTTASSCAARCSVFWPATPSRPDVRGGRQRHRHRLERVPPRRRRAAAPRPHLTAPRPPQQQQRSQWRARPSELRRAAAPRRRPRASTTVPETGSTAAASSASPDVARCNGVSPSAQRGRPPPRRSAAPSPPARAFGRAAMCHGITSLSLRVRTWARRRQRRRHDRGHHVRCEVRQRGRLRVHRVWIRAARERHGHDVRAPPSPPSATARSASRQQVSNRSWLRRSAWPPRVAQRPPVDRKPVVHRSFDRRQPPRRVAHARPRRSAGWSIRSRPLRTARSRPSRRASARGALFRRTGIGRVAANLDRDGDHQRRRQKSPIPYPSPSEEGIAGPWPTVGRWRRARCGTSGLRRRVRAGSTHASPQNAAEGPATVPAAGRYGTARLARLARVASPSAFGDADRPQLVVVVQPPGPDPPGARAALDDPEDHHVQRPEGAAQEDLDDLAAAGPRRADHGAPGAAYPESTTDAPGLRPVGEVEQPREEHREHLGEELARAAEGEESTAQVIRS